MQTWTPTQEVCVQRVFVREKENVRVRQEIGEKRREKWIHISSPPSFLPPPSPLVFLASKAEVLMILKSSLEWKCGRKALGLVMLSAIRFLGMRWWKPGFALVPLSRRRVTHQARRDLLPSPPSWNACWGQLARGCYKERLRLSTISGNPLPAKAPPLAVISDLYYSSSFLDFSWIYGRRGVKERKVG